MKINKVLLSLVVFASLFSACDDKIDYDYPQLGD
jgi:hypothetical protein